MKTYLESIGHFSDFCREELINEAPHTRLENVPQELSFLRGGYVDLGFENLGLNDTDRKALSLAFTGTGVKVPNTTYKLRYSGMRGTTVVEPATGDEHSLPADWSQGVFVIDDRDRLTWIGKKVRPDQVGTVNHALYQDKGDGWQIKEQ